MKRLMNFSRHSVLVLLGLLLFVPSAGAAGKSFTDYQKGEFGFKEVSYLVDEGIVSGYRDNRFKPNQEVNRGETAIMFQRALKLKTPVKGSSFKDVPATSVYADAAAATKEAGIFQGSSNGQFNGTAFLTREQMASVLVRAFDLKPKSGVKVTINDLTKISASHVDDVKVLYQNGVTVGKANGVYAPKDGVTRAEFSVFMYRALMGSLVQHPEQEKENTLAVTKAVLKTTNGTIQAQVKNGENIQVIYDLTNELGQGTIVEGLMSVNVNSTLTLNKIPSPINLVVVNGAKQELQQGENILSFANNIEGINFSMIRSLVGNFTVGAILEDENGNKQNLSFTFKVE